MLRNDESRASVQKVQAASSALNNLLNSQLQANAQQTVDGLVKYLEQIQNGIIEVINNRSC